MATKAEQQWMDAITQLGCIVCHLQGRGYVPCDVHHMLSGGRRIGHLATIGLCSPGHHRNAQAWTGEVSRHPTKAQFEERYGTEEELLQKTKQLLAVRNEVLAPV
jgi:hypothetical protein